MVFIETGRRLNSAAYRVPAWGMPYNILHAIKLKVGYVGPMTMCTYIYLD